MKTKGALVWDFHQPWSVEEIEIGDPRKGEVKVALEVAGMCHSDHHIVTGDIPVAAFPGARRSRRRGRRRRGRRGRRRPGARRSRRRIVHPVLRRVPVVPGRSAQPVRPRNGPDVRYIGVGRDVSGSGARPERLPVRVARDILAVSGRAPDLGGQDRPGHPLRGGGPCQLRRDDGMGLGDPGRRCPAR